jgi:manganese transport protein
MPKTISFRSGLSSVLFWSVISAAFIGPGTVTTTAKAGSTYGLTLLWALTFSIVATILLQEAAARITLASGKSLGQIIALKYPVASQRYLRIMLFIAVAFGCAAYEAGNILGAVAGLHLLSGFSNTWLTLAVGALSFSLLWAGNFQQIARILGMVVFLMGAAFFAVALFADPAWWEWKGLVVPRIPPGAGLLTIGLIGTTIVPYNLFLASGIGQGQRMSEMRIGLSLAVLIGGLISGSILVACILVKEPFSFEAVAATMTETLGHWASWLFGFGLFAAGATSAVTAPLAAAITARGLLGARESAWTAKSPSFRAVWMIVLAIGLLFSLLNVKPIPAIILAQAINGVLLPLVAVFLLLAVNDSTVLPAHYRNGLFANIAMLVIVGITGFLGFYNILTAARQVFPTVAPDEYTTYISLFFSLLLVGSLLWRLYRKFNGSKVQNSSFFGK